MSLQQPVPITKVIVCSACGMNWEEHGESPTLEDCVRLLKAELANRPKLHHWNAYGNRAISFNANPIDG